MPNQFSPQVIQQPGIGDEFIRAISPLLQQMQAQKQQQFQQQQLELQEEQLEMQGLAQRSSQRNAAITRGVQLMQTLGPGILDDEKFQGMMAEAGVDAKSLKKTYDSNLRDEENVRGAQQASLIASLPDFMRTATKASLDVLNAGGGREQAFATYSSVLNAQELDPEKLQDLRDAAPSEIATLPRDEFLQAYAKIQTEEAMQRLGLGQAGLNAARLTQIEAQTELTRIRAQLVGRDLSRPDNDTLRAMTMYVGIVSTQLDTPFLKMSSAPLEEKLRSIGADPAMWRRVQRNLEGMIPEVP